MLAAPIASLEITKLADWLELTALTAPDGNASRTDLEVQLSRSGVLDRRGGDAVEAISAEVVAEISARELAAPRGYSFSFDGGVVSRRRGAWRYYSSYLLCLCLSYFGNRRVPGVNAFPERVFESLATAVASRFVDGDAVRFGAPRQRSELDPVFVRALPMLPSRYLREGVAHASFREQMSGDAGLDVIAWRHNPDGRPGKLMLFGSCATGSDWPTKPLELNLDVWLKSWLIVPSPVIRAFFIPFRVVPDDDWSDLVIKAGIVFDRCRMAQLSPTLPNSPHGDGLRWAQEVIKRALAKGVMPGG